MAQEGQPTIAFVGSGVMAEVMISGLLSKNVVPASSIIASGPRSERGESLNRRFNIRTTTSNLDAIKQAEVIVLSVKPQSLAKVLKELRGEIQADHLVISIIAGARMRRIASALKRAAVVRCMPNLPCRIHRGMTVWTATRDVSEAQRQITRQMLSTVGKEIYVDDEGDLDRATAVNGTGPAIIAYFVKALEDAANFIGESRPLARQSVLQTIIGTAELILDSDQHIGELIDGVTSPGGTTSRALHVLHQGKMAAILTDAINAAYLRSRELGTLLDEQVAALAQPEEPS